MIWDHSSPIPRIALLLIYFVSNSGVTPAVCNGTLFSFRLVRYISSAVDDNDNWHGYGTLEGSREMTN